MKKIFLILILFAVGGLAFYWQSQSGPVPAEAERATTAILVPSPSPQRIALPERLLIPKLAIETSVESVGMEENGRMGVPSSAYTAGWWQHGVRPGETGSSVLAGHLDTPTGEPGVFYNLTVLEPGDEVIVVDQAKQEYKFEVVDKEMYEDATFPIEKVFLSDVGRNLNLITCSGTFDRSAQNYDKRLVVFTRLVNEGML